MIIIYNNNNNNNNNNNDDNNNDNKINIKLYSPCSHYMHVMLGKNKINQHHQLSHCNGQQRQQRQHDV